MDLITGRNLTFGYGGPPLLDAVDFRIGEGERVGLIGRNGEGKSTLLKLCAGRFEPESGEMARKPGLRVAVLDQQVPDSLTGATFDFVAGGVGEHGQQLVQFHQLSAQVGDGNAETLQKLDDLQAELDASGGWEAHREVERILARLQLDGDASVESLSAGRKRRVLLAQALVSKPELLLLDEPTNHLDVESILLLEDLLVRVSTTTLFVTHDRAFLRRTATRILDLDRGRISSWECGYEKYLERKESAREAELQEQARLDKKLAEEEAWIRKGIRARRTRNEGRVRALMKLREERRSRREAPGKIVATIQEADRSGRVVIKTKDLHFAYGANTIVKSLTTTIARGDRIGIIGPNGVGKTTLLRLLLGDLDPQLGAVSHGTQLEVAYFDQLGEQLDDTQSVADNVADGHEFVTVGGRKQHVIGYLQGFLFPPERARTRLSALSGGERNRVLLARLFTRPANVLVLDEPTNDLDTETLELLEELLLDYDGTLLLVSHDREFLDNVVTSCLAFDGDGQVHEFAGGLSDWLRARARADEEKARDARSTKARTKAAQEKSKPTPTRTRLSFKEKKELEALPAEIETLETRQKELHQALADPALYREGGDSVAELKKELEALEQTLSETYERWEELEERHSSN